MTGGLLIWTWQSSPHNLAFELELSPSLHILQVLELGPSLFGPCVIGVKGVLEWVRVPHRLGMDLWYAYMDLGNAPS